MYLFPSPSYFDLSPFSWGWTVRAHLGKGFSTPPGKQKASPTSEMGEAGKAIGSKLSIVAKNDGKERDCGDHHSGCRLSLFRFSLCLFFISCPAGHTEKCFSHSYHTGNLNDLISGSWCSSRKICKAFSTSSGCRSEISFCSRGSTLRS